MVCVAAFVRGTERYVPRAQPVRSARINGEGREKKKRGEKKEGGARKEERSGQEGEDRKLPATHPVKLIREPQSTGTHTVQPVPATASDIRGLCLQELMRYHGIARVKVISGMRVSVKGFSRSSCKARSCVERAARTNRSKKGSVRRDREAGGRGGGGETLCISVHAAQDAGMERERRSVINGGT